MILSSKRRLFSVLLKNKASFTNINMNLSELSSSKCFEGYQKVFAHHSEELNCDMKFGVYLPPNADKKKFPVLYWLSGITSTEENFIRKAGAQRYAAQHEICIVNSDTSPRNINIPGEDDLDYIGSSAGFYVDATQLPWSKHYRMHSYVTKELIEVVQKNFPVLSDRQSISGHSMGGHGSLICALKNPGLYRSISSLEPIANPINTRMGQEAFTAYLGNDRKAWCYWDATELALRYDGPPIELFIDQGTNDSYYDAKELLPENLVEAASKNERIKCFLKMREGYDHSSYYVASVIEEHIAYHSEFLKG